MMAEKAENTGKRKEQKEGQKEPKAMPKPKPKAAPAAGKTRAKAAAVPEPKEAQPAKAAQQEAAPRERPAPAKPPKAEPAPAAKPKVAYRGKVLMFNRWDTADVRVNDPGLAMYINLSPSIVPRTGGRHAGTPFRKESVSIVERFMNKLMVPGHRGKKHKITSGRCVGNTVGLYNDTKQAFELMEKRTGKNPFQVFITAIENACLLEEVASYRLGGIIARQSVLVSPQRRVDLALRYLTQGIYRKAFKGKKHLAEVMADEVLLAYKGDSTSFAISERNRLEKEAEGSR
jgi:small subunit ribosomal protein S7